MTLKCVLAGLPAGGGEDGARRGARRERRADLRPRSARRCSGSAGGTCAGRTSVPGSDELDRVRAKTRVDQPRGQRTRAPRRRPAYSRGCGRCGAAWASTPARSSVAIQGLGSVGRSLARSLGALGVRVLGTDLDPGRARAAGVEAVACEAILAADVDVFVPCAAGGVLTVEAVRRFEMSGRSADRPTTRLADAAAAAALVERGILHAPDIIVSAGAVTEGVLTIVEGTGEIVRARVAAAIAALETVTYEVPGRRPGCAPPTRRGRPPARTRPPGRLKRQPSVEITQGVRGVVEARRDSGGCVTDDPIGEATRHRRRAGRCCPCGGRSASGCRR